MISFEDIISRAIRNRPGIKVPAEVRVDLAAKGTSLQGTLEVRMSEEVDVEDIEQQAFNAAVRRIEDILDNQMSQDILDGAFFTATKRTKKTGKIKVPTKGTLTDSRGRFISQIQLSRVLNTNLFEEVKKQMGAPALVYRTGRFAHSAAVTGLNIVPGGRGNITRTASVHFTYMLAPYQVFEKSKARDPRNTIKAALLEALRNALSKTSFERTEFIIGGPT